MSFDAVSGISGSSFAPLDRASAVNQAAAAAQLAVGAQATGATSASGAPAPAISLPKPAQPLLLVPTMPLTPAVLAELIGRQL
jgi:hypothetical protein